MQQWLAYLQCTCYNWNTTPPIQYTLHLNREMKRTYSFTIMQPEEPVKLIPDYFSQTINKPNLVSD
jgi:hypothetical protein